ncbi:ATPase, partial [Aggregatibacter actinomycetemcomitans serotype e str. ANH9776]
SLVARRAHNPKVVGSNPAPATNHKFSKKNPSFGVFLYDKFVV